MASDERVGNSTRPCQPRLLHNYCTACIIRAVRLAEALPYPILLESFDNQVDGVLFLSLAHPTIPTNAVSYSVSVRSYLAFLFGGSGVAQIQANAHIPRINIGQSFGRTFLYCTLSVRHTATLTCEVQSTDHVLSCTMKSVPCLALASTHSSLQLFPSLRILPSFNALAYRKWIFALIQ